MSITAAQRRTVRELAGGCCEYCRIAEGDYGLTFQIDPIIPVKHGGTDDLSNLCLACFSCNSFKGPNVAALDPLTLIATRLFDPRQQNWDDHFRINDDLTLYGLTPEGRATMIVLRLNDEGRVKQREDQHVAGNYPCAKG